MGRAGEYITNLSGEAAYRSFRPTPLPPEIETDSEMAERLSEAAEALARLDTLSAEIPDVNLFVSMYVRKEALLSSHIEGTQATLDDVLDPLIDENVNRNAADVINYIKAIEYALERRKKLPLCNRLLRETHAVMMKGVRGMEKSPGEFRTSQNWIGASGCTIKNARYIPPSPEDMKEAMSDLEKYINGLDGLHVLIQAALIHYQFETIHPFLDGNGRIGRLLVTLFLMERGALRSPTLYISYYLKKNRVEYYDRLSEVRRKDNYEQWIKFFLSAVAASAQDAAETVRALSRLHNENIKKIERLGRAANTARKIFDYLEQNPIIDTGKTAQALNLSFSTVSAAIKRLVEEGILIQTAGSKRNKIFCYDQYMTILRKDTEI